MSRDSIDYHLRQGICSQILNALDMPDVRGKLGNKVKMPGQLGQRGIDRRLVVCAHMELSAFQELAKMLDGQVDGQQLSVKRAISGLGQLQSPREERDGTPLTIAIIVVTL